MNINLPETPPLCYSEHGGIIYRQWQPDTAGQAKKRPWQTAGVKCSPCVNWACLCAKSPQN